MYNDIIKKAKEEFDKAVMFLENELLKIRTGRATPSLVEDIVVDVYNEKLKVKELAAISCPSLRQILIQPWDKSYLKMIESAIQKSSLGLSPVSDSTSVRLSLPSLTEEYRKGLTKVLKTKQEEVHQMLRRHRDEAWDRMQKEFKDGKMREDEKFKGKEELQKLVDQYNNKVKVMGEEKIKELEM